MAPKKTDPWQRFLAKVDKQPGPLRTKCWLWTGAKVDGRPYFQAATRKTVRAHAWAWEYINGPRDKKPNKQPTHNLHHLCEQTLCVNPRHLKLLTPLEHRRAHGPTTNALKTHCDAGHEFTPENTYVWRGKDGYLRRKCRVCKRTAWHRFYDTHAEYRRSHKA